MSTRAKHAATTPIPVQLSAPEFHEFILPGFDHSVGHPLLLLCDTKAPNCRKNKTFKGLGHYS